MRKLRRDLFLLWQGQLVSVIGNQIYLIAIVLWLKSEMGLATLVGLLMALSSLPSILLGPIGGAIADRYPRKAIIVICDVISGVLTLLLVILLLTISNPWLKVLTVFIITLLLEVIAAVYNPATFAMIPDLVEEDELLQANALIEGTIQVAKLIGQAVGGMAYVFLGIVKLIIFDGVSFIVSAISEMFIRSPESHLKAREGQAEVSAKALLSDLRAALRYLLDNAGMRNTFIASTMLNFFAMPIMVLLPFFVESVLSAGPEWYGFLTSAFSAGGILGFTLAGGLRLTPSLRLLSTSISLIASVLGFALMVAIPQPILVLASMILSGLAVGFFNVQVVTLIQQRTPQEMHGRLFGLLTTLTMGAAPISMALAGILADTIGDISVIYWVSIVMMGAVATWLSLNRDFHHLILRKDYSRLK